MKLEINMQGLRDLSKLANRVRMYPAAAARADIAAVNEVASDIMIEAARDISQRYNLTASYVREKFNFTPAKGSPVAIVTARRRVTRLARFDAKQLTKPAPNAKGDKLRKIAAGRKQAGVSVKVLRNGPRKTMPGAFLLPLRAGKIDGGNGFGIFVRSGDLIAQEPGPSPYQAFTWWFRQRRPDLQQRLLKAWVSHFAREVRRK